MRAGGTLLNQMLWRRRRGAAAQQTTPLTSTPRPKTGTMDGCMRILHTAGWHLGDRLGRIDRTADLQRAVEDIGHWCLEHQVDVLLVGGDLFRRKGGQESLGKESHIHNLLLELNL